MNIVAKGLILAGACAVAVSVQGAEWLGTGGDTLWGNGSNWESATGVPVGNIAVSSKAGDNRTITLDGDHAFSGTFVVTAGTEDAPIVFDATAEAIAASNYVEQTSDNGFDVKSGGVLKIESGVYDWANDYRVADASVLWMTGGRMTTKYWGVLSGTAQIKMDGGELVSGWRNNAEVDNGRLNMKDDSSIVMTGGRIRCANNTNKNNDAEALTIGENAGTTSVSVSGGEIVASGKTHLGKTSGAVSTLSVSGTGVVSSSNDMRLGYGGANSTLTVDGNGQVNVGTTATPRWLIFDTGTCTINLNGGTLQVGNFAVSSTTDATINFNGGTLKPEYSYNILGASDYVKAYVLAGGAVVDTDYGVTIAAPLLSGVAEGETDGGLVKKGRGQLTLSGANTYNGLTYVHQGLLSVTNGYEFAGGLRIGSNGAISVDMTAAVDTENIAVDDTLVVFKAPTAPTFDFEADTLADSIFLTGPVFSYTLAYDSEQGAVIATVTDVANIASSRKATAYIATDDYIDQDSAWSNGQPTDRSYDIVVFTSDATMNVYAKTWGDGNNRACETMAIRGATVLAQHPDNWNPCLDKNKVVGHGTLQMRRLGIQAKNAPRSGVAIGANVKMEVFRTSSNSDTWMTTATVYGDFEVTTGLALLKNDSVFYGNAMFSNPEKNSYVETSSMTGNAIYGDWIIADGCHFDFNSAVMTIGEDARLVLKGTGYVEDYANAKFPTVVLEDGANRLYADVAGMATADGTIFASDGTTLKMAYNAVSDSPSVVAASNATLIVDANGSGVSVGDSLTIDGISLGDGVSFDDVTVLVSDVSFVWSVALDGNGKVVITATGEATGASRWIGGSSGEWKDAANWSRGVPSATLAALIDTDATVYFNANKTASEITIDADVTFRNSSGDPTLYFASIDGAGALGLYHVGLEGNAGDRRVGSEGQDDDGLVLKFVSTKSNGSDSWLKNVNIYAPMTGNGYARFYDGTKLYGNNANFTGTVRKDDADVRFMTPESGLPNATEIELYGTLWLWFTEGTITFGGQMTMSASGNRGINMPSGVTDVKLVVGDNDGNVTMNGSKDYQFYTQNGGGWTAGCANATLRKIGTGTMTCRVVGAYNLEANGGTTTIAADNPDAAVSVAAGAAITAGNVSVASLDMAAGSVFAPVVTYTAPVEAVEDDPETDEDESVAAVPATSTISPLTVVGAANVGGMVVRVDEPEKLLADNAYTLISAGAANGVADRIVVDADGSKIVAKNGEIWLAKRSDNNVVMRSGKEHPGFILVVQ